MNMANELSIGLTVSLGTDRVPGRLYVRFDPAGEGVYVELESSFASAAVRTVLLDYSEGPAEEWVPSNLQYALGLGLFPELPPELLLEIAHVVTLVSGLGVSESTVLTERIRRPFEGEDGYVYYAIHCSLGDRDFEVGWQDDLMFSLADLVGLIRRTPVICGCCHFAAVPGLGGDDWRHGLYCFRDAPEAYQGFSDPAARESILSAGSPRIWGNVSAFHYCPSFVPRADLQTKVTSTKASPGGHPTDCPLDAHNPDRG